MKAFLQFLAFGALVVLMLIAIAKNCPDVSHRQIEAKEWVGIGS